MLKDIQNRWEKLGQDFEAKPEAALEHAVTELIKEGDVIFLTAFGAEGCVIFHMIAELVKSGKIPEPITELEQLNQKSEQGRLAIVNLDTGYQFKETIELKDQLEEKYGLKVIMLEPKLSVAEQDAQYGKDLFKTDPDQCCYMRKLVPLAELLDGRLAWITSIRRDQSSHRASAMAFEYDRKFKLGKINPLIKWSKSDIWKCIHENQIPYNLLLDQGYDSIGCEPCTSPGEGRKGRWAGKDKIECGLHIQEEEMEQGGEFTI
ncbi:MAG: phosphoadenylyl-sulfate reductase [Candidatus Melainabacteria bacterium]|nr:phosphoadenylyl-sulfate reductase [Candidatus Melainabacteria bacterium]